MAIYELNKIVKFLKGKNIKQNETLENGEFNVYSSKTKDNGIFGKLNTFIFDGEYILITSHGAYAGTVIYVNEKFSTTSNCFVLKPDNSIVNTKFLFYLLKMNQLNLNAIAKGSAQGFLSNNDLSYYSVKIPPLETQNSIIDIIEPIEQTKNLIIQIEKKILKIYQQRKLSNVLIKDISYKINTGFAYNKKHIEDNGKYKIFKISNIGNSLTQNQETNFMKNNLLNIGDIITGLSGTIGTSKVITSKNWVSNQRTLSLTSDYPLNISESIKKQKTELLNIATGAAQKNITKNNILELKLIKTYNIDLKINEIYIILTKIKKILTVLKKQILKYYF
ncbi:restriction endonuclease subunit S [Mesomycoplasma neurolyticum]|uniref:Restriction modification enzyme subunit S2B n=1 Tax=Mesomycoplasma neurolyticum TaxID=2120 RepID=A0A449A4L5_9BACT|nr:restriction endonuclease subunit S [Mesomycoplasma neurolyticum]VEU59113.1 restriction modification enzyme subunit S2B [Mesomycoplasma neurolyticum]VEU59863.1 restriction modification enzyme subunit S2B [Mesomycoplasma neurolyticum]